MNPVTGINRAWPLILASASPRRRQLLEQIGLPFRVLPSRITEEGADGNPAEKVCALAEEKARDVFISSPNHWTLGADTIVVLGDQVLGKPQGSREARDMLTRLSENPHLVVTGFCVLDPSGELAHREAVHTTVTFRILKTEEIEAYIASKEPFGKAGSYAIQGMGACLVESITGSYTNVVGLPVCALVKALVAVGALESFPMPHEG